MRLAKTVKQTVNTMAARLPTTLNVNHWLLPEFAALDSPVTNFGLRGLRE